MCRNPRTSGGKAKFAKCREARIFSCPTVGIVKGATATNGRVKHSHCEICTAGDSHG